MRDISLYSSMYRMGEEAGQRAAAGKLRDDNNKNHGELLAEIKKLGASTVSVSVYGSDILPHAQTAFDKLDAPVRDYDVAKRVWDNRYWKIRKWSDARAEKRRKADREARDKADIAKWIEENTTWLKKPTEEEARKKVYLPSMFDMFYLDTWNMKTDMDQFNSTTHPGKPDGYDDLPAIRDVLTAALTLPGAMLTIPMETVNKIHRWAK